MEIFNKFIRKTYQNVIYHEYPKHITVRICFVPGQIITLCSYPIEVNVTHFRYENTKIDIKFVGRRTSVYDDRDNLEDHTVDRENEKNNEGDNNLLLREILLQRILPNYEPKSYDAILIHTIAKKLLSLHLNPTSWEEQ